MPENVGYRFWHMYWADKKIHFEVIKVLDNGFYLCEPVPENLDEYDDEVDPVVLSRKDIRHYKTLDDIFGPA